MWHSIVGRRVYIIIYHCGFYRPATVCRSPIGEIHETRHYCAEYHIIIVIIPTGRVQVYTPAGQTWYNIIL